jgi:hypothetical protein
MNPLAQPLEMMIDLLGDPSSWSPEVQKAIAAAQSALAAANAEPSGSDGGVWYPSVDEVRARVSNDHDWHFDELIRAVCDLAREHDAQSKPEGLSDDQAKHAIGSILAPFLDAGTYGAPDWAIVLAHALEYPERHGLPGAAKTSAGVTVSVDLLRRVLKAFNDYALSVDDDPTPAHIQLLDDVKAAIAGSITEAKPDDDAAQAYMDQLQDAEAHASMIRAALGVSYEPHQSLHERTLERIRELMAKPPAAQGFGEVVRWEYRTNYSGWSAWQECGKADTEEFSKDYPNTHETRELTVRQPVPAEVIRAAQHIDESIAAQPDMGGPGAFGSMTGDIEKTKLIIDWLRSVSV